MVVVTQNCTRGVSQLAVRGRYNLFSWRIESVVSSSPELKKLHLRVISQGIFQFGWLSLSCGAPIQLYRQEILQESLQTTKRVSHLLHMEQVP